MAVAFEVDRVYEVSGFVYVQRRFRTSSSDYASRANIWVSETTPFSTTRPTRAPDISNFQLRTDTFDNFTRYSLPDLTAGRYFYIEFIAANGSGSNPGGAELRLIGSEKVSLVDAPIISPDGSGYLNFATPSELSSKFAASNLFDQNLAINEDPGSGSDSGRAWAVSLTTDLPRVSFSLDQVYDVSDLVYAQRSFRDSTADQNATVSIWVDESTPFGTARPTRAPDLQDLPLLRNVLDRFVSYHLPNVLRGQHFHLEFSGSQENNSDRPGGTELRLRGKPLLSARPSIDSIAYIPGPGPGELGPPASVRLVVSAPRAGEYVIETDSDLSGQWTVLFGSQFSGPATQRVISDTTSSAQQPKQFYGISSVQTEGIQ